MPSASSNPSEAVAGLIERVTFHSEETGFAVLRVQVEGRRELVTVVGSLPSVAAGEWLTAEGRWERDREHGMQLKAERLQTSAPSSREGIERYLGSGLIKGIGPTYARKLVERFGEKVLEIIDTESGRLQEIEGIGPGRRKRIKDAWTEQRAVRDIMVFLHSNGVSTSRATRIYKTYGETAVETVRANPYRLAEDIAGIGFKTADAIAAKLGLAGDSILRVAAGLAHALLEATKAGHCALPRMQLLATAAELLSVPTAAVEEALARQVAQRKVVEEEVDGLALVYLPPLHYAECEIARMLALLAREKSLYPPMDLARAVPWCEAKTGRALAPSQRAALEKALGARALVITGGPGVGKTTLVNSLLLILRAKKVRCLLCAPTGRAAKRLGETTGLEAQTIHRLLEFNAGSGGFVRNEDRPLDCDLLVVDETSMVDVPLMHKLLRALPPAAHLLLVGDVDQLPSVGPGSVLADIIASAVIPVVRLTEVFRQAAHSRIIRNAHRINRGELPEAGVSGEESDFFFIERDEPAAIASTLVEVVRERIPKRHARDPMRDIQVLTPMNRGSLGARELNAALQLALNPPRPGDATVEKFGVAFRPRDKVIQTVNNYDKEVFNGDIGQVRAIDPVERELVVRYDRREVTYDFNELDEIALAYAITIHKSQGSEFPVVVLPLAMQHYLLLQRNLLYTAVTRGKAFVVIVGQAKALEAAVRNATTKRRFGGLLSRLNDE
ncbi:MAG TPA: ATP-dependent RecD-like DNA helicase [Chthoniobacteraceae bacterium]|nr:ATP-dependent RecD-like DNA helicase [Chthoniobacteraceae bacterium]